MELILGILLLLALIMIFALILLYKKSYQNATNDIFDLFIHGAYEQRIEWFKTMNKYKKDSGIVFVGDSITNEFHLTEIFKEHNVYNRGIGGDTTVGVLKRLDVSIFDLNPSKVFILIGTNDIELDKRSNEDIFSNIKQICNDIEQKSINIKIYIISLLPISKENNPKINHTTVGSRNNNNIKVINSLLNEYSYQSINIEYIDAYNKLVDEKDNLRLEYTREGLHLSPKGYEALEKVLRKYL